MLKGMYLTLLIGPGVPVPAMVLITPVARFTQRTVPLLESARKILP